MKDYKDITVAEKKILSTEGTNRALHFANTLRSKYGATGVRMILHREHDCIEAPDGTRAFGVFDSKNDIIHIAGLLPEFDCVLETIAHEFKHYLQKAAGEAYNEEEAERFAKTEVQIYKEWLKIEITYGEIYYNLGILFPKVKENVADYRPAETPCSIRLWMYDGRVLIFTYESCNKWSIETEKHYKMRCEP